jgi:hypothetical protein
MVLGSAAHPGFKLSMVAPAWVQGRLKRDLHLPSILLSLFSTANIWLVWRLARCGGADEREALWAAAAMASSNAMFYWSRHLMPYDLALFWALASASFALRPSPRPRDSFLAGVLGFAAFVTYAGSWSLVACVLAAHVLSAGREPRLAVRRAALGLAGLAAPFASFVLVIRMLGGELLATYGQFAATIVQGDFNEGHIVFLGYLWSAERLSALIWVAALAGTLWMLRSCAAEDRRRAVLPLAILVGGSNLLDKFVVYGRLARQVVPFCALLVGWAAVHAFRGRPWRWAEVAALAVLLACGLSNMRVPLRQEFPKQFRQRAAAIMRNYDTAAGSGREPDRFRLLYDHHIYPYPDESPLLPGTEVLLESPHPLAWRPYLYEGYTRAQRDRFAAVNFSMQLVLLPD